MSRRDAPAFPRDIATAAAAWVARRDAGLSPAAERELQTWLAADARHRAALDFYSSTWSALVAPARSGSGTQLEQQLSTLARRRHHRRVAGGVLLASLLLAWFATWTLPSRQSDAASPGSVLVLMPARQILPDGSVVELRGNARIDLHFSPALRHIVLTRGEAHFSVTKDPARPFVVSAAGVEVRAVGTAFSVQLGSTAVDVLVTEGEVAVASAPPLPTSATPSANSTSTTTPALPSTPALAAAGKRVLIARAAAAPATPVVPQISAASVAEISERLAWRSPRLEFTRTPLAEAITLLNQNAPATAPRFEISDPAVAAIRVSGIFRADNTDAFVLLLEGAFDVKADRTADTIALRRK